MESTKSSWAALFGGITVMASLLLLAWETRQNTHAIAAQAIQNLNGMSNDTTLLVGENPQLATLLVKGSEELSSAERLQRGYYFYAVVASFESAYIFYSKGLLNENDYSGWKRSTCGFLHKNQDGIEFWESQRNSFSDGFVAFVDTKCISE